MTTFFGYIFWGLVLVVLDFNIDSFDILPDVLGYALVAVGAAGLAPLSAQFALASTLSWFLAACHVIGYFISGDVATLFGLLVTVLNCAMMWTLLGGILASAAAHERLDLAERAANRRLVYVALIAISTVLGLVARDLGNVALVFVLPLVVAGIVVMVMILHLIHRVRYELRF